jgi:hypothetical protein
VDIALAARASVRDSCALAGDHKIRQHLAALLIEHDRTERHSHQQIFTATAVLLLATSGLPVARNEPGAILEIQQRGKPLVCLENNAAAVATVASRRPSEWAILFASERNRAVASFARVHIDCRFIDKAHLREPL